ncbi:unnamed protein product [Caenorhabditis bovis]|uniref:J domain-containing protein n=1 Tax=Caenorhabditis bovis TaxID=2654633 RepID=A0A8S1FEG4_9PELO|nr:unnamed protein product [Caenorhabditis bovis]
MAHVFADEYPMSVEDPEKHFLGNLLDDVEPLSSSSLNNNNNNNNNSSTTSRTTANDAPTPSASSNVVSSAFGSIGSQFWPEPPPPYSPRIAADSWGIPQTTPLSLHDWLATPTERKEPSVNNNPTSLLPPPVPPTDLFFNILTSSTTTTSGNSAPTPPAPSAAQQQIHHFHHNLHHHTHTHNQVQNHFFTTPPPPSSGSQRSPLPIGSERTSSNLLSTNEATKPAINLLASAWEYPFTGVPSSFVQTPFTSWKSNEKLNESPSDEILDSSTPDNSEPAKTYADVSHSSANVGKGGAIGSEKKKKVEMAKKLQQQQQQQTGPNPSRIVVNGQPHSAPVLTKMPFSYRDVAARVEPVVSSSSQANSTAGDGSPPQHVQKNSNHSAHLRDEHHKMIGAYRMMNTKKDHENEQKRNEKISDSRKSRSDNEFQKITRKSNKKEKSPPAPPVLENTPPVDAPSRYDVLNNLDSPTNRQRSSAKKSGNNRAPVIEQIFSRSSSPADDTEGEEVSRTRSASTHTNTNHSGSNNGATHARNQKKRVAVQSSQKRRPRRKAEPHWTDNFVWIIVEYLILAGTYVSSVVQWTFQLVIDVCLKVYDVFLFSTEAVCHGVIHSVKKFIICFFMVIVYVIISAWMFFRSLTITRVIEQFLFEERPQITEWGCRRDLPIPATANDYIERLIRENQRDAYTALGLRAECSDDDIKRNYKRLSALVSPDKCQLDGAEEAYDLVNRAYEALSTPLTRVGYIMEHAYESEDHRLVVNAWDDLRERIEDARCTIYCDCGNRHIRIPTNIRPSEARYCRRCDMTHPAKQNDIWVEKRLFGLKSIYLTCADNAVYDISEWATCEPQKPMLRNMRAHTHHVQYRLVTPPVDIDRSIEEKYRIWRFLNENMDHCDLVPSNYSSTTVSSSAGVCQPTAAHHDSRFFNDFHEELLRQQRTLAQISFKNCEPREEDRSRRAANRRQKRWR